MLQGTDDETAEDAESGVQPAEMADSDEDVNGSEEQTDMSSQDAAACGFDPVVQDAASAQVIEEPAPKSDDKPRAEPERSPEPDSDPEPDIEPLSTPQLEPEPEPEPESFSRLSTPTHVDYTRGRGGQPTVSNSANKAGEPALQKPFPPPPARQSGPLAVSVSSEIAQEPEEPSLVTAMSEEEDGSIFQNQSMESAATENKKLRQLVANLSSSLKAERARSSSLAAEKREALQHVRVLERRLARILDASTASNVHETLWAHGMRMHAHT